MPPLHSATSTAGRPGVIYAIADADALGDQPVERAVAAMAEAGVRTLQLRAKGWSGRRWHTTAAACCRAIEGSGAALWIDDRADVAALFPVEGVHVGQHDLPPASARSVLGSGQKIGLSTHDSEQLRAADADGDVDWIAVGPVFPTTGKAAPDPVVGLDLVRRARQLTRKPLIAIGGIGPRNLAAVLAAGADAVAVIGAVCRGDVAQNCRHLLEALAAVGS